jgi:hypothetical protein
LRSERGSPAGSYGAFSRTDPGSHEVARPTARMVGTACAAAAGDDLDRGSSMATLISTEQSAPAFTDEFRADPLARKSVPEQVQGREREPWSRPVVGLGTALLPQPIRAWSPRVNWSFAGRVGSHVCFWIGALVLCVGVGGQSPITVNVGAAAFALAMAAADLGRSREGGITVITLHSLLCASTALANVVGLRAAQSVMRDRYFIYTAEDHVYLASLLQLAQGSLPVVGFWLVVRSPAILRIVRLTPTLESRIERRPAIIAGIALSAIAIATNLGAGSKFVDTFGTLVNFAPSVLAFALARLGAEQRHRGAMAAGLTVALADSARAFFFDYLRGTIAQPLVAYTSGAVLGARSLRPLRDRRFLPVLVVGAVFVAFYGLLGETRSRGVHGLARFADLHEYHQWRSAQPGMPPQQTIVARLTSFNQLSQIGALVERNGFYAGRTFEYLRYAFIPRVFWPEKPKIALGAWYAMEIGQAVPTDDGWYNNSVNMTQAGELYLNFGWLGVIGGLLFFGAALAFFWTRTNFWELGARNFVGSAFAAWMLWTVLGGHGEFTLLVTLLGVFLALYALSVLLGAAQLIWALLQSPRAGSMLRQLLAR